MQSRQLKTGCLLEDYNMFGMLGGLGSVIGGIGGFLGQRNKQRAANNALNAQMAGFNLASPYLGFGFGQAQNALQNALGGGLYGGPTLAGLDPAQQQAYSGILNQASNNQGLANQATTMGSNLMNAGAGFGTNAQNIFNMANPSQTMQTANMYANNPFLDDTVNASMRAARRQVFEGDIPSARLQSASTGNPRSTRLAMKEGLIERGLAEQAGDLRARLGQQAFNTGLNQANADISNALAANTGLANAFSQGQNTMGFGQQFGFNQADALQRAGQMMQGQNQAEMDDAQKQFYMGQDRPMSLINQYLAMINGGAIPSTSGVGPTGYMDVFKQNPLMAGFQGGLTGGQMGFCLARGLGY